MKHWFKPRRAINTGTRKRKIDNNKRLLSSHNGLKNKSLLTSARQLQFQEEDDASIALARQLSRRCRVGSIYTSGYE